MTPPEGTSWQALVRARMQEEIDEWVVEGRSEDQSDRPLVLLDVMGVVAESKSAERQKDGGHPETDEKAIEVPAYMPDLVGHLSQNAEVRWSVPIDDEMSDCLTDCLGAGPFGSVEADEYGMTEPAARELLWKAAAAGRVTYRIENVSSEISSRLPDSTVLINIAPDRILKPDHLPSELRPA